MADHHSADHQHGSMDIREQEKTFSGFIRMSIWVTAISIGILIFLALVNS
jgi:Ni,Fe-hydrogenase I cytochrome b subunit